MDVLMRRPSPVQYSLDTAHTIEVSREEDENGEFGSFGFTLLYEKPPVVGTIVPGGPAQKAGLKKDDIVLTVNGEDVTILPHQKVVNIISQTPAAGVWLKVCDPDAKTAFQANHLGRSPTFSSMSSSTPNFPRGLPSRGSHRGSGMRGVGGTVWEPPPKYSEVPPTRGRPGNGVSNLQLGRGGGMVSASMANMSPLNRQVLMSHPKAGLAAVGNGGHQLLHNGYGANPRLPGQGGSNNCYTSASVMVLYIGPVEIPETWSTRGISSKCIQECTRRLLSQRQEFIEAFLEVSTTSMKVLNVSRNVLYRHKREELFYCGTCTDDEQYFAIVTRKIDPKLVVDPEVGQTMQVPVEKPAKAHICHVFQVIRNKSILVLHAGDKSGSEEAPNIKPKTVQILSCLTIIKAIEALFIGEATGGAIPAVLLGEPKVNSSNTSFRSVGSAESNGSSESVYGASPDKPKKKKDVVDLRPSAFNQHHSSTSSSSLTYASSGVTTYTAHENMSRSRDYLHPMDTPAFSAMGSSGRSWYKVDSPKETAQHTRQGSYEGSGLQGGRPDSWNYGDTRYEVSARQSETRRTAFEKVKKISDESSISSHSSGGGTSSPNKLGVLNRTSHSPSPSKSLSHSSGSRSRSPSPSHLKYHPHHHHHHHHHQHQHHQQRTIPSYAPNASGMGRRRMAHHVNPSQLASGMALEVASRSGALSPTSTISSVSRFRTTLRRQGSENSIIDLHQVDAMRSGAGLPPKNGALTSSIGSIMTVTTLAEEEGKVEEVGRVGGWIASFDKLLEDPLGLVCLQQYLEKEHCEENILFWKDAKEYSEKSQQMTSVQAQAAAKKIYDQYLSPSSPHTVNVDDRAMKGVEAGLANPTPNLFAEANEQIYQLVKMDCYMRFKRSDLVKECLLADMQGDPLPIGPATPITKNPWKKQKEAGFSRSLFGRFGRNKAPPSPPLSNPTKSKKESKSQRESPSSRKSSRDADKRNSGTEIAAPVEEFPPERHLDILQTHKGDIFEVNLPNKVTKIMAVPKKGTVREAIDPVMKKNNYSLEVMDLKFADTLKPVSLESPAHILIGQHIIVLKSAQTFIATFPDGPEHILPASQRPVQELIAGALNEMGKLQKFAVYLENSRVPFSASVEASGLVGQKVTVKYLGGQYDGPGDSNMDDLFSMIERLAGDTLQDQRTSPTPRNTPEPGQLSPSEIHQRTRSHGSGSFRGPRMSPRSSDSSPEMRSKTAHRQRANSSHEKKPLAASHSIGQVGTDPRGSESLRKFQRTQSGVVVPQQTAPINFKRTYSPPVIKSDRKPVTASPPLPSSRPPALPSTFHQAQQQQLRAHRSNEELIRDTQHASSGPGVAGPHAPKYFPRALPATDSTDSLGSSAFGSIPETLNRGDRGRSPGNKLQSPSNSDVGHPLDSFVNEASVALPSSSGGMTTGVGHGRQHSTPAQMPSENYVSSYPWRQAQPPPNPRRYTQQQTPRTAAQRHHLTQNQELMRTGDQLVQKEIEDFRHRQLTSSHSSYSDTSSTSAEPQPALSPTTTHILLPDEERQRETFV